jgi:hypothetical protein
MLKPPAESDQLKPSDMIPKFWDLLRLFWDKDRVEKWRSTIFPDSQNPNIGVEGCFNLISLSPNAYVMWTKGLFALKPLKLSRDRKELTVQFFWQIPGNYNLESRVDLLTEPTSSEGLDILQDGCSLHRVDNDSSSYIQSGETFTFTTKDPKNLPLPSLELLEMQWVLQRLVGMCGAAEWPILDLDDDDTADNDDGWQIHSNVHNPLKRVREWVGAEEAAGITPESSAATLNKDSNIAANPQEFETLTDEPVLDYRLPAQRSSRRSRRLHQSQRKRRKV